MAYSTPVLAADRIVHFASRATFAEALEAALSAQWIIVSPRLTIRLHRPLALELRLDSDGSSTMVSATPRYWRGSFLGMQVEPADVATGEVAKTMLAKIRQSLLDNPEREELPDPPITQGTTGSAPFFVGGSSGTTTRAKSLSEVQEAPAAPEERSGGDADGTSSEPAHREGAHPFRLGASRGHDSDTTFLGSSNAPKRENTGPIVTSQPSGLDPNSPFLEEPTQPGMHSGNTGATFGGLASQLTEISHAGLVPAWGVTDEGLWNEVFHGISGSPTPADQEAAALEGEFVALRLEEVAAEPLQLSARLLLMPDDVRLYTLLMALALRETTCKVTLTVGGKTGTLLLRRGMLVSIDPPGEREDLLFAKRLLADELVTARQVEEAGALAIADKEPLGVKLYEKGALTLDVLTERLRELRESLVLSLLETCTAGAFRIEPGIDSSRRRDPVRVNLVWVLASYMRRRIFSAEAVVLQRILEPFQDRFPRHRDNFSFPREALGLTATENQLLESSLMGRAPLGSLLEAEEFQTREGLALLVELHHFGFLDWLEESLTTDGAASVEAYLERRFRNLKALGHFERLDVHWATPPARLELGMRMVVNRFGPQSHLARHSSASARLCAQIVSLCQESYSVLLDPESRRRHRVARYGESKMQYAAKFLARQAHQLFDRGMTGPAVQMLESASDLVADPEWKKTLVVWKESTNRQAN